MTFPWLNYSHGQIIICKQKKSSPPLSVLLVCFTKKGSSVHDYTWQYIVVKIKSLLEARASLLVSLRQYCLHTTVSLTTRQFPKWWDQHYMKGEYFQNEQHCKYSFIDMSECRPIFASTLKKITEKKTGLLLFNTFLSFLVFLFVWLFVCWPFSHYCEEEAKKRPRRGQAAMSLLLITACQYITDSCMKDENACIHDDDCLW